MNRKELIEEVSKKADLPSEMARRVVDAVFGSNQEDGSIASALQRGEKVQLSGFGTFEARERQERLGRNPQSQKPIVIPASIAPKFRPSARFRQLLGK